MFGTLLPLAEPLLVELISRTSWQTLWLPFITAIVGSAVALFGVFCSNFGQTVERELALANLQIFT